MQAALGSQKFAPYFASITLVAIAAFGSLVIAPDEPSQWVPYGGRGRVSSFLLNLTEGPQGLESIHVPEGFEVELAVEPGLISYGVFFAFDDRGRLFVCESAGKNTTDEEALEDPSFRIKVLEDSDGDGVFDQATLFADKITLALGAQWYRGSLYVAAPPDVLRFEDTDGDNVADQREVILTGWPLKSNATTLHGPYLGPDGWMYLTYSPQAYRVKTKEGEVLEGPRGRVFRHKPDGTRLEWFVGGGFDNPVEVVFTTAGETIGSNTYYSNPKNGVRDSLLHYIDGGVYPKWRPYVDTAYQRTGGFLPAVTKFARVAPAGLMLYRGRAFGAEYEGNLFSAQFNPHRVQRHIPHREGSTYRTDDEDFLTSSDIDLHLTDVLEDADGSVLVLDTGAWYLHSCPVSRVAKPEFEGTIFRVRRKGAPRVEDPWGRDLKIEALAPERLAPLLEDPRLAVRDQAFDHLIRAGSAGVDALRGVRENSASGAARAAATFALARIDDPEAKGAARAALGDRDLDVRIAAARMAGLNEDAEAIGRLEEMVVSDLAPARLQAAEALGRIGEPGAIPALLEAAAKPQDRFLEHAIIYALIRLRTTEPLAVALKDPSPHVRKAALIALDQMEGRPLRREQFLPFLVTDEPSLGDAALWVAARHPEWPRDVTAFLRSRLAAPEFSAGQATNVQQALVAFCPQPGTQEMMAGLLAGGGNDSERQLFLLDAMTSCSIDELPPVWLAALGDLLDGAEAPVRQRVLLLIASWGTREFDAKLRRIAADESESDDLRTAAWSGFVAGGAELPGEGFRFLAKLVQSSTLGDLRLSAAQALSKASLTTDQLFAIAGEVFPRGDPLTLPTLLDCFGGNREESVGLALVAGLSEARLTLGSVAGERLGSILGNFSSEVRSRAEPLMAGVAREEETRAERLEELTPLLTAAGDTARGRNLFFGRKAACSSCHTIGVEGGHVGPDLTAVGSVRSGLDILEAVVFPNASFVPEHEVYRVETKKNIYSGVRGESTEHALVIISGPREQVRIPRKQIVTMELSAVSLMPDGFDKDLSQQELTDLLAFLQAQKSRNSVTASD